MSSICGPVHTLLTALSVSAVPNQGRLHLATCVVWSPTGIDHQSLGRYSSSCIQRIYTPGWVFWSVSASVCRRHPDLWVLSTGHHWQSTESFRWLCRGCRRLDAFQSTSTEGIQDGSTVECASLSTKSATLRPAVVCAECPLITFSKSLENKHLVNVGHQVQGLTSLRFDVACQLCAWSRYLGSYIDADLTMWTQVTQTFSKCFAALRQVRSIRRSASKEAYSRLLWRWCSQGSCQPPETAPGQAAVCRMPADNV